MIGYDYKDPFFDSVDRAFRGFGRITITPLLPATGSPISNAVSLEIYNSQRGDGLGSETMERLIDGSGVPISETLYSYADSKTAEVTSASATSFSSGISQTYFSARTGLTSVEYPSMKFRAILDLGFDGRWPLANRTDHSALPIKFSQRTEPQDFDPNAATGGGLSFRPTQSVVISFTDPKLDLNLTRFTLEAWVKATHQVGRQVIVQNPDGYELSIETTGEASFAVKADGIWTRLKGESVRMDTWTHLAASFDGRTMRLFINGIQVGTQDTKQQ